MHIGFHYHVPALYRKNQIFTSGPVGRFVDSLAAQCQYVTCFLHTPRPDELDLMDYGMVSQNIRLVDLGEHVSVPKRLIRSGKFSRLIRSEAGHLDMLLLRGPSPLLPVISAASPVPVALLLVGDYLAGVNDLPQPLWRKQAIRLWMYWNKFGELRAVRNSLTFVNSRLLLNELKDKAPHLHEIRTTTLTETDFFFREDTCQSSTVRLLYIGRMDRGKGLLEMVEAVVWLVERGEDVSLDLVGWPEPGDSVLNDVQALTLRRGVVRQVHYLGSRPLGPELFACYREADIFVIASLASEGFPRTIWEAMAHSLPVVATRVGSIPAFIEGAALLVPSRDITLLAEAISRLIHDSNLRQCLIAKGRQLVRENTLENRAREMVDVMQAYLKHGIV